MSDSQLDALKQDVAHLQQSESIHLKNHQDLEKKLDGIQQDVHAIKIALVGDPNQDNPSIMMRLDRLERAEKLRSKVMWAIGLGIVSLILERLKDIL